MIQTPQLWLPDRLRQRREDEWLMRGRGGLSRRWMPGYPCCCGSGPWCYGGITRYFTCWWPKQDVEEGETFPYTAGYHVPYDYEFIVDLGSLTLAAPNVAGWGLTGWTLVSACGDVPNGEIVLTDKLITGASYSGTECRKQYRVSDWCTFVLNSIYDGDISYTYDLVLSGGELTVSRYKWVWEVILSIENGRATPDEWPPTVNQLFYVIWRSEEYDTIVQSNEPTSGTRCTSKVPATLSLYTYIPTPSMPYEAGSIPSTITFDAEYVG